MKSKLTLLFLVLFFQGLPDSHSQVTQIGLEWIELAINGKRWNQADSALKAQLKYIKIQGLSDSLPQYLFYVGRIESEKRGKSKGIEAVQIFVDDFLKNGMSANLNKKIYREAAGFFEYIGETALAYDANVQAFEWAIKDPDTGFKESGKIQNNLATYSLYLGKRTQAKIHVYKAIDQYRQEPQLDAESMYLSYNALGNIHWFGSRFDSAEYFFGEAMKQFPNMEPSPRNQYYRPAMVLNNLAGVQAVLGKTTSGIQSMETTIRHLTSYIEVSSDEQEKAKGREFLYQAIDNLAGMHKGLGNYSKARELLEYAYEQKKNTLGPESAEVFKSQILLGQIYFALREYDQAELLLLQGLDLIASFDGDYIDWQADAYGTLAKMEKSRKNIDKATVWYQEAEKAYQKILGGDYDFIYLDFLTSAATFYAAAGSYNEAIQAAHGGLKYVQANQGKGTLLEFNQQINLAEVHFLLKEYRESFQWSRDALQGFDDGLLKKEQSWLDSIQIETKKPKAILLQVKSSYFLQQNRTEEFLKNAISQLDEAIEAVARRKTVLQSDQDLGLLIAENQDLYDFAKQLDLELFEMTGEKKYMESLLTRHESSVFNRLRSRLQRFDNIRFANLPTSVQGEESILKTNLVQSLQIDTEGLEPYLQANQAWEEYLGKLKINYPDYYRFRYGNLQASLEEIQMTIPAGTSLVRYMFIGSDLAALVMDSEQKILVKLDYEKVAGHIETLSNYWNRPEKCLPILYELYVHLWQPLTTHLPHKNIIIIPDGPLYNLSFELLTPAMLSDYRGFLSESLLAKYRISYHFHSHLLKPLKHTTSYQTNYVAFAPGFSDKMKTDYLKSFRDSLLLDKGYLTLIPQPFTQNLVAKVKSMLGGKVYTENQSTLQNFVGNASGHRIIHIGTHAESNNLSPDFSKLIFSKSLDGSGLGETNELYAFDIYNLHLNSQIAVLTACETGRSTIDPGEGMLSLAHAFSYAGSESLLVGLWKIDEKASSLITEVFYQKLAAGMDKASALREAKLHYLSHATGRALSPEFWAGIVLIGDSSPIYLETIIPWWKYFLIGVVFLIALGLFWRHFSANEKKVRIPAVQG